LLGFSRRPPRPLLAKASAVEISLQPQKAKLLLHMLQKAPLTRGGQAYGHASANPIRVGRGTEQPRWATWLGIMKSNKGTDTVPIPQARDRTSVSA
jgi:hypothetical protein